MFSRSWDTRLLQLAISATLLSPYVIRVGPLEGLLRVDHILVPVVALFVLLRSLPTGRVSAPVCVRRYALFLGWLIFTSVVGLGYQPRGHELPSVTTWAGSLDAYTRPLLWLFVVHNISAGRKGLLSLARLTLVVGIVVAVIGVLQLLPATSGMVNRIILDYYDNERSGRLIQLTVAGGRAVSLFGQAGTFGMYNLVCLGLALSQLMGGVILRSRSLLWVSFATSVLGGILSGSKLFTGGVLILTGLLLFTRGSLRRLARARNIAFGCLTLILVLVAGRTFVWQYEAFKHRVSMLDPVDFYEEYLGARLGSMRSPVEARIIRTGAVGVFLDNPVCGIGFNGINQTGDSLWMGLLVMGGVVGVGIYGIFLKSVFDGLNTTRTVVRDVSISLMARAMMLLGVVFLLAAAGFHTFIQDRSGDIYWVLVGLLMSPAVRRESGGPGPEPISKSI